MVSALFRDAKLADLIEQMPCILDDLQLGPLVDKDPEWRAIISDAGSRLIAR